VSSQVDKGTHYNAQSWKDARPTNVKLKRMAF
jgi:hypothetical protein